MEHGFGEIGNRGKKRKKNVKIERLRDKAEPPLGFLWNIRVCLLI
jgi:hypothetical protein